MDALKQAKKNTPPWHPMMSHAYWTDWKEGVIVLEKDWLSPNEDVPIHVDPGRRPFKRLELACPQDYAMEAGYYCEDGYIHFVLNTDLYDNINWVGEEFYVAGDFNGWAHAIGDGQWKLNPKRIDGKMCFTLAVAYEKCKCEAKSRFKFVTASHYWLPVPWSAPNWELDNENNHNYVLHFKQTGRHRLYFELEEKSPALGLDEIVWMHKDDREVCRLHCGPLLLSLKTKAPLGATIEGDRTRFAVFAPRATRVQLVLFKNLEDPVYETLDMCLRDDVYWEVVYPKNVEGYYYFYYVDGSNHDAFTHFDPLFKIVDPYALALVSSVGPGIVLDAKKIKKNKRSRFKTPCWHDLVILEVHLRDIMKNAPIDIPSVDRLGYKGLTEWVRTRGHYFEQLGVNAIELMPIQEFQANGKEEYHWGYMPVNYFAPCSQYAAHPDKASQVRELQDLVYALHECKLAVILDVVYNHVGEPNYLLFLDKYHYFEVNDEGHLMNFSGCGNDVRASAPMARRLIIDSLIHLVETYDIDGFRFDLAELIGTEVLLEIEQALKQVKPSIVLIAEPWSFRGHIAYELKSTGFASWNDGYRKFIKKYVKGESNHDAFAYYIKGSLEHVARFPAQTVNYASSHDDRCWVDSITEHANHDGRFLTADDRTKTHLMCSMLMASLGIPMLAQGTDMLHSKHGVNNTYQDGQLNAMDYQLMVKHSVTHCYFKDWIHFRLSDKGRLLRLAHKPDDSYIKIYYASDASSAAVLYNANGSLGKDRIFYAINPHEWTVHLQVGDLHEEDYMQIADHERFDVKGLKDPLIHWHGGAITMPPLSCGLWILRRWFDHFG